MNNAPPAVPPNNFGSYKISETSAPSNGFLPYIIIIAFAVLILGAGFYFFFFWDVDFSLKSATIETIPPLTPMEAKASRFSNLSFQIIDDPFFRSLKIYGALPIVADGLGRENPFIPY